MQDSTIGKSSGALRAKTSSSRDDSSGNIRANFRTGLFAQNSGTVRSKSFFDSPFFKSHVLTSMTLAFGYQIAPNVKKSDTIGNNGQYKPSRMYIARLTAPNIRDTIGKN